MNEKYLSKIPLKYYKYLILKQTDFHFKHRYKCEVTKGIVSYRGGCGNEIIDVHLTDSE